MIQKSPKNSFISAVLCVIFSVYWQPPESPRFNKSSTQCTSERHPGVLPAAPVQGLPCPGTRKSLVWASLFWIPAGVPFCHLLPLPRDFFVLVFFFTGLDIWTPVLDFPVLPPCPGFLDFPFFTCSMTTSSPLCGRPFLYLSLAACRLR